MRTSLRRVRTTSLLLIYLMCVCGVSISQAAAVREGIRQRIEAAGIPAQIIVGDEVVHAVNLLPRFYEQRGFSPAWSRSRTEIREALSLVQALREANKDGLQGRDYHLNQIDALVTALKSEQTERQATLLRIDLDLLCTDAFLVYGAHLVSGHVNPESIDSEWTATRREVDLLPVLERAVSSGNIIPALDELRPDHPAYNQMRHALQRYRRIAAAGGWNSVDSGQKLQVGSQGERVRQLRQRLQWSPDRSGSDSKESPDVDVFDATLAEDVRRFQLRHGLDADAVVGPASIAALNVSVEDRIRQIMLNLERWRWLPQDLGERFVLVNIPAFEATVVEAGTEVMRMRVIVGRAVRRTPVFSGKMTYLVLNPYWEVPPRLAAVDKLPEIRKDPSYLQREGMRVFSGWGPDAKEIDPAQVDWSQLGRDRFPYRLRQDPGPRNALGQVKFMFPNKHSVYLHDTPGRTLFEKSERSFSSGCIRVEKPLDLAAYLLQPEWSRTRIDETMTTGTTVTVSIPRPPQVHLLYWTAWVEEDGVVAFRRDLYGRDALLAAALTEPPPDADDFPPATDR